MSERKFIEKQIKRWEKEGFKYTNAHIDLLKYSYRRREFNPMLFILFLSCILGILFIVFIITYILN